MRSVASEWCSNAEKNHYGLGGPRSKYFNGWFAELPVGVDGFQYETELKNEDIIRKINSHIETKTIIYPDEILSYSQKSWLTPALWIDVPEDWKIKIFHRSQQKKFGFKMAAEDATDYQR